MHATRTTRPARCSRFARAAAAAALLLPALAPHAAAQTGPWTDGEAIMKNFAPVTGARALFRIIPETGETALLTTALNWGGWSGAMTFDSHRNGVVINMAKAPDNANVLRVWVVSHDGTAASLPGFTGHVRALASANGGRIFFVRHTGASQGPQTIEYFDSNDGIQTLKHFDGITPFQADVERLLYHAPTNSLIGASSAWWSATHCGPTGSSLYRIPLTADGYRVDGAMTCTSISTTLLAGEIVGLDTLPDGDVLVVTGSSGFPPTNAILRVNPLTLAVSSWAEPTQGDVNGGFWSARLGRTLVHANSGGAWWEPEGLRSFSPGETGFGMHIPTSVALPVGGGSSPVELLIEADLNGPACEGLNLPYGAGLAGTGDVMPQLGAIGCTDISNVFTLSINGVVGGAPGVIFVGLGSGAIPFKGGTFHLNAALLQMPVAVGGTPGVANAGSLTFPVALAFPVLTGVDIYLQAAFVDAGAVQDVSLTNGLRVQGN